MVAKQPPVWRYIWASLSWPLSGIDGYVSCYYCNANSSYMVAVNIEFTHIDSYKVMLLSFDFCI